MSGLSISSPFPFPDSNTFQDSMKFLELADIGRVASVCKSWNTLIQSPSVWKNLFEKEGIPPVISLKGEPRDYREDLKTLYPITLSGKVISQFLGKMVGQVPSISEKWFNKLQEEDPFEKGKSIRENYVFVVVPSLIKRTINEQTPLSLDESRNLIELSKQGSMTKELDLPIPFSLKKS